MRFRAAALVLESGRCFFGSAFGARESSKHALGEVVFNTSLTGYQEILTDPSYAGQIVVMTAPQIGNTGVNLEDEESERPRCAGFVVRELSPVASNFRSRGELGAYLEQHGIVGIQGVDTRALTRELREGGAQRGLIVCGESRAALTDSLDSLRVRVLDSPSMEGRDLVADVTCTERYTWDEPSWRAPDLNAAESAAERSDVAHHVVAYDFGIKRNILRGLRDVGCRVTVLPATTPPAEALSIDADGFFLSNGPGDPAAVEYGIEAVRQLVASKRPIFGICLGHQILSLALGAKTYKLRFGHHGGNHPVMDLSTRKVEITSQNHGFAVDSASLPENVLCTHVNLYDDTVEGIRLRDQPVFGIQYHPEGSPGPHDAAYLFRRFVDAMAATAR